MFGFAALVVLTGGWWGALRFSSTPPQGIATPTQHEGPLEKRMVYLYFGDASGHHLVAEERIMAKSTENAALGERLVQELILGPSQRAGRTLPADAQLRSFFFAEDGTAYIDFNQEAFDHHPGGVGAESLSIYSVVNTLILNVEAIRAVKFLIGGKEAETLAGHVALNEPFEVDMLWVR